MKVIVVGSSGMVGQGVLRECLLAPDVERVLTIVRKPSGQSHEKLVELVHADLNDLSSVDGELAGYDACFWCLGVTSSGLSEDEYRAVTVGLTRSVTDALVRAGGVSTFVFVSGAGSDATGKSSTMWARVKGEAENLALALPFKTKVVFRPAFIRPMHGITSRTTSYRVMYAALRPVFPLIEWLGKKHATTTERMGLAMLAVARKGAPKGTLESHEINALLAGT